MLPFLAIFGGGKSPSTVLTGGGTQADIQAAVDGFGAGGGCIEIGPGVWIFSAALVWPTTGDILIKGCGESTIVRKAAGAFNMIEFPTGYTQNALICDLKMDPAANLASPNNAIQVLATAACKGITFKRLIFESSGSAPSSGTAYIKDAVTGFSHNIVLDQCRFRDTAGNHNNFTVSSNNFHVSGGSIVGQSTLDGNDHILEGMDIDTFITPKRERPIIRGNNFNFAGTCINASAATLKDIIIEGNQFISGAGGVTINIAVTSEAKVQITDNRIKNAIAGAISVQRNDGQGSIHNNIISDVAGSANGIAVIGDGSEHTKVQANDVKGSSTGIGVKVEYDNSNISDNYVEGFTGGGIVESGAADKNQIHDNILKSNGAAQLVIIGPGTDAANNKLL